MISREKCLEWAKEEEFTIFVEHAYLRIAQRIYVEGQKDMRERAANAIEGQRYMLDALLAVKTLEIE